MQKLILGITMFTAIVLVAINLYKEENKLNKKLKK